jgi:hypothetical protein
LWWRLLCLEQRLTVTCVLVTSVVVAIGIISGIGLLLLIVGTASSCGDGGQVGTSLWILRLIRLRVIGLRRRLLILGAVIWVGGLLHPATPRVSERDAAATIIKEDILLTLIEVVFRQTNMQDFRTKFLPVSTGHHSTLLEGYA